MYNTKVKADTVRLVLDGSKEVLPYEKVKEMAEGAELDIICLSDKAEIPVVTLGDWKKFQYEQAKKEKERQKKARENASDLKIIKIGDATALNDLKTKARNIDKMLNAGDKVKIVITYRGRSIRMIGGGEGKINALVELVTAKYMIDKPCRIEGNTVSIILAPDKKAK